MGTGSVFALTVAQRAEILNCARNGNVRVVVNREGLSQAGLARAKLSDITWRTTRNDRESPDGLLLTILAVLCNCKNADFTFLRKMCQAEETEFYRQLFRLQQAGLIWTHELPNGALKKVTRASITPTGWQIVNQIYNESRLDRGLLRAGSSLA